MAITSTNPNTTPRMQTAMVRFPLLSPREHAPTTPVRARETGPRPPFSLLAVGRLLISGILRYHNLRQLSGGTGQESRYLLRMAKRKHTPSRMPSDLPPGRRPGSVMGLRIVGGRFRGRRLLYSGDARVRPMKDRTREAIFNLLGTTVVGKHAIDLFAGTGALALEALSRGAERATLLETHVPTVAIVRQNIVTLDVEATCDVVTADTFRWWKRRPDLGPTPWLVFCSPPYAFYVERRDELLELLRTLLEAAPADSLFVVES
ncbi:MAG: RsmD family RNA methyltransferase, partial [Thermoguttaceae bacterium]